jgi:hypothetical protein
VTEAKRWLFKPLVAPLPVEAFDEGILHRLARPDEIELDVVRICPRIHRPADKLAAVVDYDGCRRRSPLQDVAQRRRDLDARERTIGEERERLARVEVEHGQRPKPAAINEPGADESMLQRSLGRVAVGIGTRGRLASRLRGFVRTVSPSSPYSR